MSRPDESHPPAVVAAASDQPTTTVAPDSFESALERLEAIVARMEGERLPLEELLACYEQGTRLLQTCGDFLQAAEQRIELITRGENGQPQVSDFPPSSPGVTAAPPAENQPSTAQPANPTPKAAGKTSAAAAAAPGSRGSSSNPPSSSNRKNHEVSLF
ncbi:MAG: exodeoxyribonuclease VII small subunit [Verrucomicrobia bacterium]|nr:exodeoxyribonuclease VII small subunit [Verrucomicrobiota bacterium]